MILRGCKLTSILIPPSPRPHPPPPPASRKFFIVCLSYSLQPVRSVHKLYINLQWQVTLEFPPPHVLCCPISIISLSVINGLLVIEQCCLQGCVRQAGTPPTRKIVVESINRKLSRLTEQRRNLYLTQNLTFQDQKKSCQNFQADSMYNSCVMLILPASFLTRLRDWMSILVSHLKVTPIVLWCCGQTMWSACVWGREGGQRMWPPCVGQVWGVFCTQPCQAPKMFFGGDSVSYILSSQVLHVGSHRMSLMKLLGGMALVQKALLTVTKNRNIDHS